VIASDSIAILSCSVLNFYLGDLWAFASVRQEEAT
jgi:hypothetical protein